MLVECNHCGAPLDVSEGSTIVKCRYCSRTSRLQMLRTVAPQTPRGWRPPPQWTVPPHLHGAGTSLKYHGAGLAAIWLILLVLSIVTAIGGCIYAILAGGKRGITSGGGSIAVAQLAPVTLRESPEQLARILKAGPAKDHRMYVRLSGSRFEAVNFEWDKDQTDHVKSFHLNASGSDPRDEEIKKRLRDVLGRRFQGDQFRWEGCGLHIAKGGGLSVTVDRGQPPSGENAHWREQAETLWAVVRTAALGLPGSVDPQGVRDWLGGGYPIRALSGLDPDTDVDRSEAAIKALFRGAVRSLNTDLTYTVALDHPWFGHAELSWANKKASRLTEVELRPPPGQQKFGAQQAALVACMTAALGKPDRESEGDHLRGGGKDVTYLQKGGEVRIYDHMVTMSTRGDAIPRELFQKVAQALDGCGRGAR